MFVKLSPGIKGDYPPSPPGEFTRRSWLEYDLFCLLRRYFFLIIFSFSFESKKINFSWIFILSGGKSNFLEIFHYFPRFQSDSCVWDSNSNKLILEISFKFEFSRIMRIERFQKFIVFAITEKVFLKKLISMLSKAAAIFDR